MKKNKKTIIKAVTVLLMMTILITGCSTKLPKDAVAVVNGSNITLAEFEKTLAFQIMAYENQLGPDILNQEISSGMTLLDSIKKDLLDRLILDELLLQQAAKNNITVTDEEIEEVYLPYLEFIENNESFKEFSQKNNIDEDYIRQQIKKDIVIHKYRDFYIENLEISGEAAKAFYDENLDFFKNEQVSAKHILVRATAEDAQAKAQKIAEEINNYQDFIRLWEGYKEAPVEGIIVEDLSYFGRGEMVPEFEEAAFSLKANEVSPIVETMFGYHIILVEDSINEIQQYEEVKDMIIAYLKDQDFQQHIEKLKEEAKIITKENL